MGANNTDITDLAEKGTGHSGVGRSDTPDRVAQPAQPSHEVYLERSARQGTVVIRASVEHTGLAGDTEMTVTIKWPASAYCAPLYATPLPQTKPMGAIANVPPNGPAAKSFEPGILYGDAEFPASPSVTPVVQAGSPIYAPAKEGEGTAKEPEETAKAPEPEVKHAKRGK